MTLPQRIAVILKRSFAYLHPCLHGPVGGGETADLGAISAALRREIEYLTMVGCCMYRPVRITERKKDIMILKTLDYRQGKHNSGAYEEWNYFDNIVTASNYYDEDIHQTVVRCSFRDGNNVAFAIPNVAYLMSDSGKTIDKIYGTKVEELGDTESAVYNHLQDAANAAMEA